MEQLRCQSDGLSPLYLPLSAGGVFCFNLVQSGLFRAIFGRTVTFTSGSNTAWVSRDHLIHINALPPILQLSIMWQNTRTERIMAS